MSDVYCRDCEPTPATVAQADSPACLATLPLRDGQRGKGATLLNVRSELEMLGSSQGKNVLINSNQTSPTKPVKTDRDNNMSASTRLAAEDPELEFGDDVSAGMRGDDDDDAGTGGTAATLRTPRDCGRIRVQGAVELPTTEANAEATLVLAEETATTPTTTTVAHPLEAFCTLRQRRTGGANDSTNGNVQKLVADGSATLPKFKRANSVATSTPVNGGGGAAAGYRRKVPMRTTPDGTNIYYWCELSKRAQKGAEVFL